MADVYENGLLLNTFIDDSIFCHLARRNFLLFRTKHTSIMLLIYIVILGTSGKKKTDIFEHLRSFTILLYNHYFWFVNFAYT